LSFFQAIDFLELIRAEMIIQAVWARAWRARKCKYYHSSLGRW